MGQCSVSTWDATLQVGFLHANYKIIYTAALGVSLHLAVIQVSVQLHHPASAVLCYCMTSLTVTESS